VGAVTAPKAAFVPPILATLVKPTDYYRTSQPGDWQYERKLDGLRGLAVRNADRVDLLFRNRLSFNARFPDVVATVAGLPCRSLVTDGELIVFDGDQTSSSRSVEQWPSRRHRERPHGDGTGESAIGPLGGLDGEGRHPRPSVSPTTAVKEMFDLIAAWPVWAGETQPARRNISPWSGPHHIDRCALRNSARRHISEGRHRSRSGTRWSRAGWRWSGDGPASRRPS
jgi:hypothetical protein